MSTEYLLYFAAIIVVSLLYIIIYGQKYIRMVQLAAKIPGPSFIDATIIAVKTLTNPSEVYKFFMQLVKLYPDIVKIWLGPRLMVFLYQPDDIELVLSSSIHIDKSADYSVFKPWFGNGLLISTGNKWKHHRKMIAGTFHQSVLKTFVPKFYENSLKLCDKMKREEGKTFDCHDYLSGTTVDILLDTAMGYAVPRSEKTGYSYAMAVMKLCDIFHRRHYKIWLNPNILFKWTSLVFEQAKQLNLILNLTTKVVGHKKEGILKNEKNINENIKEIKEAISTKHDKNEVMFDYKNGAAVRDDIDIDDESVIGEKKRLAFLEQLIINAQNPEVDFTDQDVLDQVNTIMFEGHDTTAACSSFVLCLMGIHKDAQEKVIEEIDEIFQRSDRECTFADTLKMKYLERVIMETIRMYPPVPLIARQLNKEVKLKSGNYFLPIGTTIVLIQAIVHRLERFYPNADVFNPDNFLPEKCQNRHYYSYFPFSAGPRSCVGRKFAMLKLKVMLSTIFRKYRVECGMKEKDFKLQADIIMKIAGGFNIRLIPRVD